VTRRIGLGVAIGSLAAIAISGATLAFTGPTNGSFETGAYVDGGAGFEQLNAGDTSITGWTVDSRSVDWIGSYWAAEDGSMSIDLSGAEAGSISQTLATTIGNKYTVSFFLSGNPAGPPAVKTVDVTATGAAPSTYTYDTTANDLGNMNWTAETFSFLATSTSTTLSFVSTTAGAFGPALDNVTITESVPTMSDCKVGGWQTLVDNVGNSFKNQGDCVSYFATGGRNLGSIAPVSIANLGATTANDAATPPVKHSTKQVHSSTTRHTDSHGGARDKSKSHGGVAHTSHGHHSK
jgi:choice-of-anchor C domain-containing protein